MSQKAEVPTIVAAERSVDGSLDEVVEQLTVALQEEGFGILCDIDVQATLKEKLGVDRAPYRILGACNPQLADRALGAQRHLGLLLPCNVVVQEDEGEIKVSAVDAKTMLSVLPEDPQLDQIASEVNQRLVRAIQSL